MLSANAAVERLAEAAIGSGMMTPLMRYCRLAWSPRTCSWPKESCTTPGACRITSLSGVEVPSGSASMSFESMR